ncbi:MAG: nucleotidyltransferase domain-containing protein [Gemmatimonadota bacterium]
MDAYLSAIVQDLGAPRGPVVSLILFGSAATGGHDTNASDVDLLVVLDDGAVSERERVSRAVGTLETQHGFAKQRAARASDVTPSRTHPLQRVTERITGTTRAYFLPTRADLLSGDPARVLGIARAQALFVDRIVMANIVSSGVTVWGEALLCQVPLRPIRRFDVGKAGFNLANQAVLAALVYPVFPGATRVAMDALKSAVHSCYFCHHGQVAALQDEVAFFDQRYGTDPVRAQLLALRARYRPSFGFVIRSVVAIVALAARTALALAFPRPTTAMHHSTVPSR